MGRDPAWIVDPGPDDAGHLDAVAKLAAERGGAGGIALTHDHADHAAGVEGLRARTGAPVADARGAVDVLLRDGDRFGPLTAIPVPGHAADHLAFVAGSVCFTGDAVLGEGSVFVSPGRGALAGYLRGLGRLRALELALICPGHGPVVHDPGAKLDEYVAHRLERERRLIEALTAGRRTVDELLDDVWADAPTALRPVAAVTLAAHLDKLDEEGRLLDGVERPPVPDWLRGASGP